MTAVDPVALVHLLGFVTSGALYALLGLMVARRATGVVAAGRPLRRRSLAGVLSDSGLALATAALGVLWNAGALVVYGQRDLGVGLAPPAVAAIAFAALGLLPAVVVHAALLGEGTRVARGVVAAAYGLSGAAALLHGVAAVRGLPLPSRTALLALTGGYVVLMAVLALQHRRVGRRRTLPAIGLAVFAVSALHLGQHGEGGESWIVALVGHQASLPLALVILYQDYRVALADVFLKRALALVALVALALTLYLAVTPLLGDRPALGAPRTVGVLLALWIATALAYPALRRLAALVVDRVLLRRVDYAEVRAQIARRLEAAETETAALDATADAIAGALGARTVARRTLDALPSAGEALVASPDGGRTGALLRVPTTDAPAFALAVGELADGRRLLSDDLAFLENLGLLAGRRVDALRVTDERYERDVREAEMRRLASEAELGALRAQLDPHFLFNTLNTLGYLMQVAPARAHETLHHLSDLLRAVLYRSQRRHCTLGEELELVGAYLAIERARFEERLAVAIEVDEPLRRLRVPPLLLQPLVENAIKHGIAPRRAGGTVAVAATLDDAATTGGRPLLRVTVRDTGAGASPARLLEGRARGVGLTNLERRLERYYGAAAGLRLRSVEGESTTAEVWLPAEVMGAGEPAAAADPAAAWGSPPDDTIARTAGASDTDPAPAAPIAPVAPPAAPPAPRGPRPAARGR